MPTLTQQTTRRRMALLRILGFSHPLAGPGGRGIPKSTESQALPHLRTGRSLPRGLHPGKRTRSPRNSTSNDLAPRAGAQSCSAKSKVKRKAFCPQRVHHCSGRRDALLQSPKITNCRTRAVLAAPVGNFVGPLTPKLGGRGRRAWEKGTISAGP